MAVPPHAGAVAPTDRWGPPPAARVEEQARVAEPSVPAASAWDMTAAHAAAWKHKGVHPKVALRMHAREQYSSALASTVPVPVPAVLTAPAVAGLLPAPAPAPEAWLIGEEDLAVAAVGGTQPSGEQLWARFTPEVQKALRAGADAQAAWRAPTRSAKGYASAKERDRVWAGLAADALLPMLPPLVADALAGGGGAWVSKTDKVWQGGQRIGRVLLGNLKRQRESPIDVTAKAERKLKPVIAFSDAA